MSTPEAKLQTHALLTEYLKDFTLSFGYLEDSPGLDDFNKPMIRSLNFHNDLKINSNFVANYKYYISQSVVQTTSGSFASEKSEVRGIKLESSNVNLTSRLIDDLIWNMVTENGVTEFRNVRQVYFFISLELTNKVYTLERNYQTFFDYLGNLGGNFEIMVFTFVLLITLHSIIEMDVNQLNYIVLKDQQELIQEPSKLNQVSDLKMASKSKGLKKKTRFKSYSYSRVLCFKYFGWFQINSEDYQLYKQDCATLKQKLDLKTLVLNQGNINTLSSLYMKPYQIKLLSVLEKESQAEYA